MPGYTVLILGAGASLAYGLPLGKGLVEKICVLLPSSAQSHTNYKVGALYDQLRGNPAISQAWDALSGHDLVYALIEFRQRLIESDPKSIDEFLSRDFGAATKVFRQIGKLSIAHVIAAHESESAFQSVEQAPSQDHWYRYLWQDCLNAGSRSLDDLKAKRLRIVSFNYDRSLEYFLGKRIAAAHLAQPDRLLDPTKARTWAAKGFKEVENNLQITHPYGTLGPLSEVPYGDTDNPRYHGANMAQRIRVIGEERENSEDSFALARTWIDEASNVVFLGFSYDATNMNRLGLSNGLIHRRPPSNLPQICDVFPLTHGLERAERIHLFSKYFSTHFDQNVEVVRNPSNDRTSLSELHKEISIIQYLRQYGPLMNL